MLEDNPIYVDELMLLRGRDIDICEGITLHQPTISEIEEFGEKIFFNTFWLLCSVPSDMKSVLWDMGIDWNKISDWDFFRIMCRSFTGEQTRLIFGDLDFSIMQEGLYDERIVLTDGNVIIDELIYTAFITYVREMIGYTVKREKAGNRFTRDVLINEDRQKIKSSKDKPYKSVIISEIISLVNTEEFSYTYETVFDITTYQLTKSFVQIQGKKAACSLYQASMSGFVDTSKIKTKDFQWVYGADN